MVLMLELQGRKAGLQLGSINQIFSYESPHIILPVSNTSVAQLMH